jgi:putative FmdB family regulatory protein
MPLYEYKCESCGVTFEVIQKFSDHSVDTCRACGGRVRRLLSAPAIQFKGTGWYVTDYARKGSGGPESEKSSSSSESSESGGAASSTPASGADAKGAGGASSTPSPPSTPTPTPSSSDKK